MDNNLPKPCECLTMEAERFVRANMYDSPNWKLINPHESQAVGSIVWDLIRILRNEKKAPFTLNEIEKRFFVLKRIAQALYLESQGKNSGNIFSEEDQELVEKYKKYKENSSN